MFKVLVFIQSENENDRSNNAGIKIFRPKTGEILPKNYVSKM